LTMKNAYNTIACTQPLASRILTPVEVARELVALSRELVANALRLAERSAQLRRESAELRARLRNQGQK
jgi:hypothetical protein